MNPELLLQQAEAALARGASFQEVNARLAQMGFGGLEGLRARVNPTPDMGPVERFVSGLMTSAGQGLTQEFGDELAGFAGGEEARQRTLGEQEQFRGAHPVVSELAEFGGATLPWLLPGGAALTNFAGRGATTAARVGRGAGAGLALGATGAAGSAAAREIGMSEGPALSRFADPEVQDRALGAAERAAPVGGLLGMAGGAISGRVQSRTHGRSGRVGQQFRSRAQRGPDLPTRRSRTRGVMDRVSDQLYGGLERRFPVVDSPQVDAFLQNMAETPSGRSILRARGLMDSARDGLTRSPSFSDLRKIRTRLQGLAKDQNELGVMADELTGIMNDEFGEPFRRATRMWGRLNQNLEDLEAGYRLALRGSSDIENAILGMSSRTGRGSRAVDPRRMQAFNAGRVQKIAERLERGDEKAVSFMRQMMDEGPEVERQFRDLFPDDQTWQEFRRILRSESSPRRAMQVFNSLVTRPLGIGFGAGTAVSLFRGPQGPNTGAGR